MSNVMPETPNSVQSRVSLNCPVEPGRLALTESGHPETLLITDAKTGERLGELTHPENSPHAVELYWGKGGLMGLITSPQGIKYMVLPGGSVAVQGTSVKLDGQVLSANPDKCKVEASATRQAQQHAVQASILGAGLATRFERISGDSTDYSKPAVPVVGNRSVIECIANGLAAHGFTRLIVNTYFKPVSLKQCLYRSMAKELRYIDESEPSGTAGGLRKMLTDSRYSDLLDLNQHLLIVQGDSVTDADFSALMEAHVANGALVTIGCQPVAEKDVDKFGIIVTDRSGEDGQSGRITGFQEKPKLSEAKSRLGNTGFYIFSPKAFPLIKAAYEQLLNQAQETARANGQPIPEEVAMDFAMDVFPAILQKAQEDPSLGAFWAQAVSGYWSDIGNPAQYLETVHDVYAGKVNFPMPEAVSDYYRDGVIYWEGAAAIADSEGAVLQGNVVVAKPFSES
jgi:NDP-sugar pyrophosphorylase family protein